MTSFVLKLIAILLMLTDHIGALLSAMPYLNSKYGVYIHFMRVVGRASFPIFAFLISEGCVHTRSISSYLKRLAVFAVISEIPFNLFINFYMNAKPSVLCPLRQNIFFTWALGVITALIYEKLLTEKGALKKAALWAVIALTVLSAELANTDYGGFGVLLVLVLYVLRRDAAVPDIKQLSALAVLLAVKYYSSLMYLAGALCSVVIVLTYNGKKGRDIKWLFYIFYPAHLLAFGIIGFVSLQF